MLSTACWPVNDIFTVPLVAIFTKFDGLVIQEHANLSDIRDWKDKLMEAKKNAENTLQEVYVSSVMNTKYPPKAYVTLQGGNGAHFFTPNRYIVASQICTSQR